MPKKAVKAKGKKKPAKAKDPVQSKAVDAEDWLGGDADDDDDDGKLGNAVDLAELGSDEEDLAGIEDGDDDMPDGAIQEEEAPDDDADFTEASKLMLAKTTEKQGDLGALKQRIEDNILLLTNWRKSRDLVKGLSRNEVFQNLVQDCAMYYGYSEELAEYFLQMFSPEKAKEFFDANEKQRPVTLRANSLKTRRSTLLQSLGARRVKADPIGNWTKVGVKVYDAAVPIGATPEYLSGQYMIQSASSFIPVMALAPQENELVLDMAAAPGGKTTYLGQLMKNTGTLFANDLRKDRCKALVANVHRMGLTNVVTINFDGKKLNGVLPKLDRVLLDAPCTGSGIISRDPSIKVKRTMKDFMDASKLQKELLLTAIDLVRADSKTGGYIVYSTCSLSVEENEAVVDYALKTRYVKLVDFSSNVDFGGEGYTKYRERRFNPSVALCRRYYPHMHNMDGFFVAKFKKISDAVPSRQKRVFVKGPQAPTVLDESKWKPEMMETVMDFADPAAAPKAKALSRKERYRLKRDAQLAERATAKEAVSDAKVASNGVAVPANPAAPAPKDAAAADNVASSVARPIKKRKAKAGSTGPKAKAKRRTEQEGAGETPDQGLTSTPPAAAKKRRKMK